MARIAVNWCLALGCKCILWAAERLVPESLRDTWRQEWLGNFWRWTLAEAEAGAPNSRGALISQTRLAVFNALDAGLRSEQSIEWRRNLVGSPRFCLIVVTSAFAAMFLASGGLHELRRLAQGLPYTDTDRVLILAQGPPVFGVRFGFRDQEIRLFKEKSLTLAGVSEYTWRAGTFQQAHRDPQSGATSQPREALVASVGPTFFQVLGIHRGIKDEQHFLASYDFWRTELRADPAVIGRPFLVDGQLMILGGVLPREFSFLSTPVSIWIDTPLENTVATGEQKAVSPQAPKGPPDRRWWLNLKGLVARPLPGVTPQQVEKELRELQVHAGVGRRNYLIHATAVRELVYRAWWSYGSDLLILLGAIALWAAARGVLDHRNGIPTSKMWSSQGKFWGFFALKTILPLITLFCALFEFGGVGRIGITGGAVGRGGPIQVWSAFAVVVIILFWAWRDQPTRCRVCLQTMRRPMRIGVPGQMLLETSGEEIMCPRGHGSLYISGSILGANLSDRWVGFDDLFADDTERGAAVDPNNRGRSGEA